MLAKPGRVQCFGFHLIIPEQLTGEKEASTEAAGFGEVAVKYVALGNGADELPSCWDACANRINDVNTGWSHMVDLGTRTHSMSEDMRKKTEASK